jgi:LDH2 family malate/lactate/ureidoglycolate dehydrogenase
VEEGVEKNTKRLKHILFNMSETVWVPFNILEPFVHDVFKSIGVPTNDAMICRDVLLDADRKGLDTHGVNRLKPVYYNRVLNKMQKPETELKVIREGPTTSVLDACNGMGMVASYKSMEIAINKAKQYGMGMTVVRNSTHYGIAGYYTEMASSKGLIGMCGTNARPAIAPTFAVEPLLGTNPLVFSFPTDEAFPFTLDCATSIIQRGRVEVAARANQSLPEGLIIDSKGDYMTDPNLILKSLVKGEAAFLPLGGAGEETSGYKGYGYASVVEILSSALQQGFFLRAIDGVNLGHFFIAIDVEAFTELDDFKKTTGDILREIRSARREPGQPRIYTAGEKEYLTSLERENKGAPVTPGVQAEFIAMRDEQKLDYVFNFESL